MTKQERYNNLIELLKEDTNRIETMVQECNCWGGSLEDYEYFDNDEYFFNDFFNSPMEAVRACYYGDYNYGDDYVHFNAYGNLDSCSEYEYQDILKDNVEEILERFSEVVNVNNVDLNNTCLDGDTISYFKKWKEEGEIADNEQ